MQLPNVDDPDQPGRRRCTATNRQGKRCGSYPIVGGNVCRIHGGSAPQVRRKAMLRLASLVEPAIAILAREMTTAAKSADRQRAANSILDRAGYGRTHRIQADEAKAVLMERLAKISRTDGEIKEAVQKALAHRPPVVIDPDDAPLSSPTKKESS